MRRFGGMMLTGTAISASMADPLICSMSDGSGGGFGGAAALLEDDGQGGAAGGGGGDGSGGGDGQGGGGGDGSGGSGGSDQGVAEWLKAFSAEKADGQELSNQEWLAKKGVKDPDALVASYRNAEKALREGGKVKIPGEGATPEEIAAYREAIGAPKDANGYEIAMPEDAKDYEIDTDFIEPFKAVAHKHNIPAAAFKEFGDVFLAKQLEDAKAEVSRTDAEVTAQRKEWGAEEAAKIEEFKRGCSIVGLSAKDVQAIQREYGGGKTLALFAKIGALAGEDFFAGNNDPSRKFGVASLEDAQGQLDKLIADPTTYEKLQAKDPTTTSRYNRLTEAVAGFRQQTKNRR